ncbi:hypothetical protein D9619_013424 [Psilocybe cf. subviscida]|uniref:Uncharacterized protein n=1 Tax=Psilocybe cf. subviscida TaxID=2480587 RepID=A0A8H5BRX9_9AGAR|nr:hypothetical protein D9619_013424 [Psilocybe cf. subviscida]
MHPERIRCKTAGLKHRKEISRPYIHPWSFGCFFLRTPLEGKKAQEKVKNATTRRGLKPSPPQKNGQETDSGGPWVPPPPPQSRKTTAKIKPKHQLKALKRDRKGHLPHALQILFPTSSLLHSGVVLVPQFAQHSAPTAGRALPFPPLPPVAAAFGATALALASLSTAALGDPGASATTAALGEADSSPAAKAAATAALDSAAAFSSSMRAVASTLLYVGQPEHALVPPVPSQRPSPGHVPLACAVFVVADDAVVVEAAGAVAAAVVDAAAPDEGGLTIEFESGDDDAGFAFALLVSELGANGDGPTVLIPLVAVVDDGFDVELLADEGGGVRPREDGRGMCLDF